MGLLAAALAMALAQLVKAVTGFGSGLVAMPVMILVFGPAEALLLMVCCDLLAGSLLLADVWRGVRWPLVVALLLGVGPGQWAGTGLLVVLDPVWVARALGVVVVGMGASIAWRPIVEGRGELEDLPSPAGPLLGAAWGAGLLGGVLAGLVGAGGPPIIALMRRWFTPAFQRAHLIVTFFTSSCLLLGMLLVRGVDPGVLTSLPWLLVPLVLGNRAGVWTARRVDKAAFGRVTGGLLVLAGTGLLLR